MSFENDIFISYAHLDDEEGWIAEFDRRLKIKVQEFLGRRLMVWRDPELQGNEEFANTLVQRFQSVAALVSVLTPSYVNSEWCIKELKGFLQAAEESGGKEVYDNKTRVFKVIKTRVKLERHPSEVAGLLGYEFYKTLSETKTAALGEVEFQQKLDDLAQDVALLLESIEEGVTGASAEVEAEGAEKPVVYLAYSSFDVKEDCERVRRDLRRRGHTVLPDAELPLNGPDLQAKAREYMARCHLSVHIFGGEYGIVPANAEASMGVLQHDLAREQSKTPGFTRLVWIPPDLDKEKVEERQKQFLTALKADPGFQDGADFLETELEVLKTVMYEKLEKLELARQKEKQDAQPAAEAASDSARIYLICDQGDLEAIGPLSAFLYDKGLDPVLPVFEGDPAEVRQANEEELRLCDAVLVYHGAGNDLWLRKKLSEMQKIVGDGRTKPFRAKPCICVGAPETPQKRLYRNRDALVISQLEGFEPDSLAPFVAALGAKTS